jgi:hypothetical protein
MAHGFFEQRCKRETFDKLQRLSVAWSMGRDDISMKQEQSFVASFRKLKRTKIGSLDIPMVKPVYTNNQQGAFEAIPQHHGGRRNRRPIIC